MKNKIICGLITLLLFGCEEKSENKAFLDHCEKSGKSKIECQNRLAKMEYSRTLSVDHNRGEIHGDGGYYYSAPYIVHEQVPVYVGGRVTRYETKTVTKYRQQYYAPPVSRNTSRSSGSSFYSTPSQSKSNYSFGSGSRSYSGFGSSSSSRRR